MAVTRRISLALVLLCILGVSSLSAGPKYKITLQSGATYELEKVDDNTINVSNNSGELVGSVKIPQQGSAGTRGSGEGEGYETFEAEGNSLGKAPSLNPGALELIDTHVAGGGS